MKNIKSINSEFLLWSKSFDDKVKKVCIEGLKYREREREEANSFSKSNFKGVK
jgi:hypothetical protein